MVKILKALALLLIYAVVCVAKVDAGDELMFELELEGENEAHPDHEQTPQSSPNSIDPDDIEGLSEGMESLQAPSDADAAPQFSQLPRRTSDAILSELLTSSERSRVATVSKSWQWKEWPKVEGHFSGHGQHLAIEATTKLETYLRDAGYPALTPEGKERLSEAVQNDFRTQLHTSLRGVRADRGTGCGQSSFRLM